MVPSSALTKSDGTATGHSLTVVAEVEEQTECKIIGTISQHQQEAATKFTFPRNEHNCNSKDPQEI